MRRRDFITLLGGAAAAWPLAVRAQQPNQVRRIAVMANLLERDMEAQRASEAFIARLQNLGWTDRNNLSTDFRWVGDRFGEYGPVAKAIVQSGPDVIVARGSAVVQALRQETSAIPIVFVNVLDPLDLGVGVVQSLPRPGGNVTGFMTFDPAMGTKWLEIIKEIAPSLRRIGVALLPQPSQDATFKAIEAAAPAFGVQATALPVRDAADVERGIKAFASGIDGGLIVLPNAVTNTNRELITNLAARGRLPAIYAYRFYLEAGGLASYGIESTESFRSAAGYVERLLRGAKASDLPVQAPTRFQLAINLKAAKAMGLTVPPTLLAIADEVIE
jgi:putative tryptophan/tyrosine transport system substrate-binding protein